MSKESTITTRSRMRPEQRREHILAHAGELVLREGVGGVTLERVSQVANISRSLIYNYFRDANELLSSLLEKERHQYREQQEAAVAKAKSFEDVIRLTVRTTLNFYHQNGELIIRLTNEPTIARSVLGCDEEVQWQQQVEDYFSRLIMKQYDLDRETAKLAFEIVEGMAESAGLRSLRRLGGEALQLIEDITVAADLAALEEIGRKFRAKSADQTV